MESSFGRRPVLILSTLICLVSNIWRAVATSYDSYMGACILNGIGAGPAEVSSSLPGFEMKHSDSRCKTSQPEIIADVMFLHDRGAYNTLYFTAFYGALMV